MSSEENLNVLKSCMVSSAEKIIGRGKRKITEWFTHSAEDLVPLIEAKNEVHHRMLSDSSVTAKKGNTDGDNNGW